MDVKELKTILQREGGKIIIIENDKPTLVVSLYRALVPERPELSELEPESESGELTVDDLPL